MKYNTARNQLILPEYGRHVQKMVEYATTLESKEDRNKCVNAIINFMGQMNPQLRDIKEYTHKLWDHLYIMSNFQIDATSPYPIPEIEKLQEKPKRMVYPNNKIRFPFYGAALENMIKHAVTLEENREKEIMTGMIANHMKKSYLLFNKHSVSNDTIKLHLQQLSDGKLKLADDFEFIRSESVVTRPNRVYKKKFKKKR
ncbi:DUF4290 domain-containing protein [Flavobacteriales bacterium]|nr:DUF4290 domain-containing protein [Flavobacteriales bacterium]